MDILFVALGHFTFFSHNGSRSIPRCSPFLLLRLAVVIIVFFSVITFIRHAFDFFRLAFCLRPEGETDHRIEVGFPPLFPALRFRRTAEAFCPFDILSATAFGRHAGYFLFDFEDDLRPHFFPVETSRQSSLNHLRNPP
tara:strand:+ start:1204 stop:1620 length:417 start_codon:yes stop_codon:yes gene_type:complete